jgi:hypothetical protein
MGRRRGRPLCQKYCEENMTKQAPSSFKISDQVKPQVKQASKPTADAPTAPSVGFPRIEALVEQANPDVSGLQSRADQLRELEQKGGSPKIKAGAKRAVAAYARVLELVSYLLETKRKIQESAAAPAAPAQRP